MRAVDRFFTHLMSRVVGQISAISRPRFLVRWMIRWFSATYQINTHESIRSLDSFLTLGDFFTRELKPESRPIFGVDLVSPTDGLVIARGHISDGTLLQAKGKTYSVSELIDTDVHEFKTFATIYLSPKDCHRIFSPCTGRVVRTHRVSGCLYPVRQKQLDSIPHLYCKNERLITEIHTESGDVVIVVAVGALNVGSMSYPFDVSHLPVDVAAGQWLKTFHLGSTVVVLHSREMSLPPLGPVNYGAPFFG